MKVLKGIVLALVLANVGYFLYSRGIAPPVQTGEPPAPGASLKLKTNKPDATAAAQGPAAMAVRCLSVGPFAGEPGAARAETLLRSAGYAPRQRTVETDVADGVLLFVPMPSTATAAKQLRSRLARAGIADAPDAVGPNQATVISVGVFSDPQRAQQRAAALRAAGFTPQTADHRHAVTAYWLDLDLKAAQLPPNPADLPSDDAHGAPPGVADCPAPPAAVATTDASAAAGGASVAR